MPKISELTATTSPSGNDYFVIVRDTGNYKITFDNLGIRNLSLGTGVVSISNGGTNATTATNARTNLAASINIRAISVDLDGAGATIETGIVSQIHRVGFDATLQGYTFVSTYGTSGDMNVDILKCTYGDFPTFASITSSNYAYISGTKNQTNTLTGWTTSIASGDLIKAQVISSTLQLAKLVLDLRG